MRFAIKLASYFLGILIFGLFLGVLALNYLIDPNDFRDDLEDYIEEATGQEVEISGSIGWSFFPTLGLNLKDVSFQDPKHQDSIPIAKFDKIKVGVKTKDLIIDGEIEIPSFQATQGIITLVTDQQNETNWENFLSNLVKDTAENEPEDSPNAIEQIRDLQPLVEKFTVTNSKLLIINKLTNKKISFDDVYIYASKFHYNQPFHFKMSGKSVIPGFPSAKWMITSKIKPNFERHSATFTELNTKISLPEGAANLLIQGIVKADDFLKETPEYTGKLTLKTLKKRGALLGYTQIDNILNIFYDTEISGNFKTSDNKIYIQNMSGHIHNAKIIGNVIIKNLFGEHPDINFNLHFKNINLNDYKKIHHYTEKFTTKTAQNKSKKQPSFIDKAHIHGKILIEKIIDPTISKNTTNG